MEKYVYEGKNKDQVMNLMLYELNVNEEDIVYKEKEESGGFLKGKKCVIEAYKLEEIAKFVKEFLEELLSGMKVDSKIEVIVKDETINLNIYSKNNSIIIGKKGHILDAIQTYTKNMLFHKINNNVKIIIDVENYKQKQNYFLRKDAKRIAKEVLKTKTDIKLDPMKSYERKIIHDTLNSYKNIETQSEGEEPNRYIVVKYKD